MHEEHANEDRPARFITVREQVSDLYGIAPTITVTHTIAVGEITSLKTYDDGDYGRLTLKNRSVIGVDKGAAAVRLRLLGYDPEDAPPKRFFTAREMEEQVREVSRQGAELLAQDNRILRLEEVLRGLLDRYVAVIEATGPGIWNDDSHPEALAARNVLRGDQEG